MRKPLAIFGFITSIILAGLVGFSITADWASQWESTAAVQLMVDLTRPMPINTEKEKESEPEELPATNDIQVEVVVSEKTDDRPLRVLIYHSHTYEAYEPDYPNQYKQTERWRTADPAYNIIRVGAELARILREEYGIEVTHDDTAFEPPDYQTAYQRSLEALENYTARGDTFDLYIDLHRDAYVEGRFAENTVWVDGARVARLMFLVGKGTSTLNGQAFLQKPIWEENFLRADVLTEAINLHSGNLCRPVSIKASRYNQHVSTGALLVEVGNNKNSLDEALRAVPHLARAIYETSGGYDIKIQYPVAE